MTERAFLVKRAQLKTGWCFFNIENMSAASNPMLVLLYIILFHTAAAQHTENTVMFDWSHQNQWSSLNKNSRIALPYSTRSCAVFRMIPVQSVGVITFTHVLGFGPDWRHLYFTWLSPFHHTSALRGNIVRNTVTLIRQRYVPANLRTKIRHPNKRRNWKSC